MFDKFEFIRESRKVNNDYNCLLFSFLFTLWPLILITYSMVMSNTSVLCLKSHTKAMCGLSLAPLSHQMLHIFNKLYCAVLLKGCWLSYVYCRQSFVDCWLFIVIGCISSYVDWLSIIGCFCCWLLLVANCRVSTVKCWFLIIWCHWHCLLLVADCCLSAVGCCWPIVRVGCGWKFLLLVPSCGH